MSDFLAVAGVTAVLKWMLSNALTSSGLNTTFSSPASVSALSPDLVATGADEQPQLNLYMYYASLNASYRNANLPSRDSKGNRVSNPPLALDLHYLMSAYGKTELDPEILLAWAMQIFYENPVLSRSTMQNLLTAMASSPGATPEMQAVAKTTLASQFELIKIAPEALTNEEISKLWMAFNTHYRPTTSYQVSVVLIEETLPFKSNLPVQSRNVLAQPMQGPTIDNVAPAIVAVGDVLTITGQDFIGDSPADTLVAFDQNPPVAPDTLQGNTIRITIPNTLLPGVRGVRVVRNVRFGTPSDPHTGFSSSSALFGLMPTITNATPVAAAVGTPLTINVTPNVGQSQRATLFIGDFAIQLDARPPSAPPSSGSLQFNIPASFPYTKPPTALPLRLQVDSVDSSLTLDQNPASPTFGQFLPQAQVSGP
ncbi:MAG TPA: DUF4255 domain-containing protein [Bryobacteraceae bacterium]|nr:DUF4255 domain-containing protein [Bryobacteraceae bacterium]